MITWARSTAWALMQPNSRGGEVGLPRESRILKIGSDVTIPRAGGQGGSRHG